MILHDTIDFLKQNHIRTLKGLIIEKVVFGRYLAAIKLSDGTFGVSSIIEDTKVHCDKKLRDYGEFTPLQIVGRKIIDLFETQKSSATIDMLRIASLNAISSNLLSNGSYKVLRKTDPFDLLDITSSSRVTIVGAFHTYIEKSIKKNCHIKVLELNEDALSEEHKKYFVPASEYSSLLPDSDFVIITGLTLVNKTLDNLLQHIGSNALTVVTGPSSSIIPDVLFQNNVDIIGATVISKPEILFPLVGEGAAGYHLFNYCAEKISIVNDK